MHDYFISFSCRFAGRASQQTILVLVASRFSGGIITAYEALDENGKIFVISERVQKRGGSGAFSTIHKRANIRNLISCLEMAGVPDEHPFRKRIDAYYARIQDRKAFLEAQRAEEEARDQEASGIEVQSLQPEEETPETSPIPGPIRYRVSIILYNFRQVQIKKVFWEAAPGWWEDEHAWLDVLKRAHDEGRLPAGLAKMDRLVYGIRFEVRLSPRGEVLHEHEICVGDEVEVQPHRLFAKHQGEQGTEPS